jgi:hypothetical protein
VLAYETDNEAYVVGDKAPYNRMSGTVTTLDGLTYDMSDPTQRQQSADANFVVYANRMVDAVHRVDPEALVTMGAFTFGAAKKPGPQGMPTYCSTACSSAVDYRYPARFRSLSAWSRLSFLDLHIYPAHKPGINDPYTLSRNLETMEWSRIEGPVIVGEFGASKAFYGNDIRAAAYGMRDMQVDTCQRGMSGWHYWTYNAADTATSPPSTPTPTRVAPSTASSPPSSVPTPAASASPLSTHHLARLCGDYMGDRQHHLGQSPHQRVDLWSMCVTDCWGP